MQGYVEIQKCPIASISGHVPQVLAWGEAASMRGEDISMFFQEGEQQTSAREQRGSSSSGEREVDENGAEMSPLVGDDGSHGSDSGEIEEEDMLLLSGSEGRRLRAPSLDAPERLEQDLLIDQPLLEDSTQLLDDGHTCMQPMQPLRPSTLVEDAAPSRESVPEACVPNEAVLQDDDVVPRGDDAAAIPSHSPLVVSEDHFAVDANSDTGSADVGDAGHAGVAGEGEGEERKSLNEEESEEEVYPQVRFMIISRRSRHRAGTRYKRRGADISGAVANYVETEFVSWCMPMKILCETGIVLFCVVLCCAVLCCDPSSCIGLYKKAAWCAQ